MKITTCLQTVSETILLLKVRQILWKFWESCFKIKVLCQNIDLSLDRSNSPDLPCRQVRLLRHFEVEYALILQVTLNFSRFCQQEDHPILPVFHSWIHRLLFVLKLLVCLYALIKACSWWNTCWYQFSPIHQVFQENFRVFHNDLHDISLQSLLLTLTKTLKSLILYLVKAQCLDIARIHLKRIHLLWFTQESFQESLFQISIPLKNQHWKSICWSQA